MIKIAEIMSKKQALMHRIKWLADNQHVWDKEMRTSWKQLNREYDILSKKVDRILNSKAVQDRLKELDQQINKGE